MLDYVKMKGEKNIGLKTNKRVLWGNKIISMLFKISVRIYTIFLSQKVTQLKKKQVHIMELLMEGEQSEWKWRNIK